MRISIILLFLGVTLLMTGIYISSLLTTHWVVIGTFIAILGGGLMGINAHFLAATKRSSNQ
ncbi:MAG: hypothetical protein WBF39_12655 [Planococcus donghaensis]|uniref:hypothetical protein n=1 Tax=Planococcus halocryophilus TaxID=1215089 RepID=UPI001F0E92DC|nr:hypothetical protein [Planococcus halocryophilus]MCH4825327.1 hypothetical protein [Planococcus halocryophilus]